MIQPQVEAPTVRERQTRLPPSVRIVAKTLEYLALALWLGGFLTAGAVVAPLAFGQLARADAGELMGACFRRLNGVGIVSGGILMVALALEAAARADQARRLFALRAGLVGGALALALYLGFVLFPTMEAARAAAPDAAGPAFDRMHALSRQLLSLQMFLLLGVIVGSATAGARAAAAPKGRE
jgi:uncharacterized protein DUF4149